MSTISKIKLNNVKHDIRASKLGNSTVGGSTKPIYLENGIPMECTDISASASDTYNPESHDAMSGIAVNNAIASNIEIISSTQPTFQNDGCVWTKIL